MRRNRGIVEPDERQVGGDIDAPFACSMIGARSHFVIAGEDRGNVGVLAQQLVGRLDA